MKKILLLLWIAALQVASLAQVAVPPLSTVRQLDAHLNQAAERYLDKRAAEINEIQTRERAEQRKTRFREVVLHLIGGLPKKKGPLHAVSAGTLQQQGFHVERILYDSLPGFHVPADLYLPENGHRPYPAVLYTPGHSPLGKREAWLFASNLARHGVAVLAYDPIGEGERLQYFDPAKGASLAGHATGEHSEASVQIMLTGDHIARYFVWDAIRGLDYLASRPDIDAQRLGAFGCSGGGTVTAYLAALDPRVKAVGVGCYITSFHELLNTIGPQEAEQTIPRMIQDGFDLADWVEAAAPTPYAVVSTTEDMFPFAGARQSVKEAKRIYALYDAEDRLEWITGPGRHANLRPLYPEILRFFLHWLKGDHEAPVIEPIPPPPPGSLLCTRTGQVSTSLGGETLYSLNRKVADDLLRCDHALQNAAEISRLRRQVQKEIRALAGMNQVPASAPSKFTIVRTQKRSGYDLEELDFASSSGIDLHGWLAIPTRSGKRSALLLLKAAAGPDSFSEGSPSDQLAKSGKVVFVPQLLPGSRDDQEQKTALLGPFYLTSLRALLLGETISGIRIEDALRCFHWLAHQPDIESSRVEVEGDGTMGIVALHLAALDSQVQAVTIDHALLLFAMAADAPVPRNLAQAVIPGVLRSYDLDDLMLATWPRRLRVVNPVDGEGHEISELDARRRLTSVIESDRNLHTTGRVLVTTSPAGSTAAIQKIGTQEQ